MNAEPHEINAKANDDAHAASTQDGPRIGGPIILVGDRSGFGVLVGVRRCSLSVSVRQQCGSHLTLRFR
jgi:hypothetical protein